MRTTLKRGIGRASGLNGNGNGHSAAPPLFGPVTRYKQPEPAGSSRTALRWFGWFLLVVLVVGAGVGGGAYLYTHETLTGLKLPGKAGSNASKYVVAAQAGKPAIALIAGYDHRAGTGTNSYAGSNSDTLMLVRADPQTNTLSLLSFPRDLNVPIYCHGGTPTTTDRINASWGDCGSNGPAAVLDTVEHLTNLKINYLITLDFHAFQQIVDRLHGVYMNVDQRYYNPLHTGWSAINLHPGYQKLNGAQALSYVRFRHFDSDLYRTGRQQLFVEALKARLKSELSLSNFPLILQLIGALKGNLSYEKANQATIGIDEMRTYFDVLFHLSPGRLFRNSIPITDLVPFVTAGGADELQVSSPTVIPKVVHAFDHPPAPPGQHKTSAKKTSHIPKVKPLPKQDVSVLVLNAGTVAGTASNTTYLLTQQGFATRTLPAADPANAPAVAHHTVLYYDPVQPNAKRAADQLAPLFGAQARVSQTNSAIAALARKAHNPLVVVAVGTDYKGTLTLPRPPKKKQKLPPAQVSDGSFTNSAVRAVARDARFPLMAPGKVALGSAISANEGVRLFHPLSGKQELALTFNVNGGVEYWQIEEMNWSTAPYLQNPTYHFAYHHQTYLVYTSGGEIQMVALRTRKASYVVVNSILNQVSNSTMIAIAKSLHPVGR